MVRREDDQGTMDDSHSSVSVSYGHPQRRELSHHRLLNGHRRHVPALLCSELELRAVLDTHPLPFVLLAGRHTRSL
jgi:hypothetical protein